MPHSPSRFGALSSFIVNPPARQRRPGLRGLVSKGRLRALEYGIQILLTASLLVMGKWFIGLLQLASLAYLLHSWSVRQHLVDATDVFKQLPAQKKLVSWFGPVDDGPPNRS
ncbi:putative protein cornichon 2 [Tetrabaena socialis]|uniref:Uncharacterized protein n=1 Tax=Tetrabaena socialis TaxID=47790 RepID=A0A2J8ACM6_9CHLO|nr:putative protein cornichon 2 [Tetrabaena socialis]|eukprot:PNH10275.1 putative protein cornichon 2 [Tetrabaena socialis]